jgi:hypothetical protein
VSAQRAGRVRSHSMIRVVLAAVLLSLGSLAVAMGGTGTASAQPASASRPASIAASASTSAAFHQSQTIERTNLINGQNQVVDKRTVSLSVNVTTNLVNRQTIQVSWTGAHPTGGVQYNPNDGNNAPYEEYPMVLLECHGKAAQIQPEDCWTTTPTERYFSTNDPFPPWRVDRYATADDQRNAVVNEPSPLPSGCTIYVAGAVRYWLPFVTPSGADYPVGPGECANTPNEMNTAGTIGDLPTNETYAATNLKGDGSADFDVWTSELNPDLGCSDTVPCSLVAIPVMGISCDPAGTGMPAADQPAPGAQEEQAAAECEETGFFAPGSIANDESELNSDLTVSGWLWWAASNWRNRFVVPLTFAPPGNICSIVNQSNHFIQAYGSELLDQAMLQWQPHFCENKNLFTLTYAGTSEPEAATSLQQGEIEAALVSNQPAAGFPEPVVHAPVAATGFAISFVIDNAAHQPVTTLRLDPRLLAKLLTESYPGLLVNENDPELQHTCTAADPAQNHLSTTLCTNPLDITDDPEFQALNPGLPATVQTEAASALLALSSQSDVIWALTSYINDNPAARAWLNGQPDPWGMTVNSAYKGIALPVSLWPLNSTYEPQTWITGTQVQNQCYQKSPSPLLPLIGAPSSDLPTIAEDVQFYLAQSDTSCPNFQPEYPESWVLAPLGPQGVGNRFMIAVTSLADAQRYDLGTASLLTYTKPGTPDAFTSPAGMTFVAPTNAALDSAASLFTADPSQYGWSFPYSLYQQDSTKAEQAYPGTMLVYADIPTKGLKAADASDYATFLRYVATTGQVPGGGIGQLASGYLPMTKADHLGAEAAYAVSAAAAVAAQKGAIPALLSGTSGSGSGPSGSGSTATGSGSGTAGSGTTGSGAGSSKAGSGGKGTPGSKTVPLNHSRPAASVGITPFSSFGIGSYALIGVAALGVVMAVLAAVLAQLARTGRKPFRAGGPAVAGVIARIRGMRWS